MNRAYLSIVGSLSIFGLVAQATFCSAQEADIITEPVTPITSVSQLSDVQPTDWAFQALQSLVERYGVIAGYPDKTFRGNRAMTRYEFAAGLNAALDRINELIATGLTDTVRKEDLAILQRLQEEFKVELTTLRGRVDGLEARTAQLEAQQFSTTTKLSGQVIFAINGGTQVNAEDPSTVFLSRSRLNLQTSFTGRDLLLTQLQAGSGSNSDAAGFLQNENGAFRNRISDIGEAQIQQQFERIFFPLSSLGLTLEDLGIGLANLPNVDEVRDAYSGIVATLSLEEGISPDASLQLSQTLIQGIETSRTISRFLQRNSTLDYSGVDSNFKISRLSYTFPISTDLRIALFPQGFISDFIDFNRYANNSAISFNTANFSTYGLINNQLLLANDTPGAGAAIAWNPGQGFFTFRAAYRAEQGALVSSNSIFGSSGDRSGIFDAPNLGIFELEFADSKTFAIRFQYSAGTQGGSEYDALGANLELALGKHIGLFGRFGYAFNFPGGVEPTSWSAGVAFPDLFKRGNLAGISVGQPLSFQDNLLGIFNATQTNYEAFYRFQVSENISISPLVQVVTDPGNIDTSTILIFTLRTVFAF